MRDEPPERLRERGPAAALGEEQPDEGEVVWRQDAVEHRVDERAEGLLERQLVGAAGQLHGRAGEQPLDRDLAHRRDEQLLLARVVAVQGLLGHARLHGHRVGRRAVEPPFAEQGRRLFVPGRRRAVEQIEVQRAVAHVFAHLPNGL